jgi:hypothetical protein
MCSVKTGIYPPNPLCGTLDLDSVGRAWVRDVGLRFGNPTYKTTLTESGMRAI